MDTALLPLPLLLLDYVLGAIMWTLIARAVLGLFIAEQSPMVIAKVFRQLTDPFLRLFHRITPPFLLPIFVPLYVAWWFYIIRFFVIPYIFFGEMGILSFPLEGAVADFLLSFK